MDIRVRSCVRRVVGTAVFPRLEEDYERDMNPNYEGDFCPVVEVDAVHFNLRFHTM